MAQELLKQAGFQTVNQVPGTRHGRAVVRFVKKETPMPVMREQLPHKAAKCLLTCFDLRTRGKFERVCKDWQRIVRQIDTAETRPVWLYVIFRKVPLREQMHASAGRKGGHEAPAVKVSSDGPIFWSKQVVYVYCCSCHYMNKHENQLYSMLRRVSARVTRICMVDSPVDYAFLTDGIFNYITKHCHRLEFLYLRELDLCYLNYGTVLAMAQQPALKKVIVHQCRSFEVLTDFGALPQVLVVRGELQGLKAMLAGLDPSMLAPSSTGTSVSDVRCAQLQTSLHRGSLPVSDSERKMMEADVQSIKSEQIHVKSPLLSYNGEHNGEHIGEHNGEHIGEHNGEHNGEHSGEHNGERSDTVQNGHP